MIDRNRLRPLVERYKDDAESVYNTWFVHNDTRLKAFRSIRRGVEDVVEDIRHGRFPNDFKGSSLEFVLHAITEQKQVFEGAAHAFYWKPKLRIPDIYEDDANKAAFGQFLGACLGSLDEQRLLRAVAELEGHRIKGLGPAVANILYFLHPTLAPPFNTAILRGFNLLFGECLKLGAWNSWYDMRTTMLAANDMLANELSKDLGALAGLLFDVGAGKLVIEENRHLVDEKERKRRETVLRKRHQQVVSEQEAENEHSHLQHVLLTIGRALGYDVWVARNDHARSWDGQRLGALSLQTLPSLDVNEATRKTIGLIDVLWLEKGGRHIVAAWEVEKSTSIYSGILRLKDLALSVPQGHLTDLYLVVPDHRESEVEAQLLRPSLGDGAQLSYIVASELLSNCDALCRLGDDHTIMRKLARCAC
jgi:type II restriction enzyme